MRNWILLAGLLLSMFTVLGQQKAYTGKVYDGITYQPLSGASVYNMNTQKFAFTNKDGVFTIKLSKNDTLVFSKSAYRQLVVTVNDKIYYGMEDFFLYYKATMLKEVTILAINPSYEGFKKDIVSLELPDYYKRIEESRLSEWQKANAKYNPEEGGNILSLGGKMTTSPITYLYEKFSRRSKMDRLYHEMLDYDDEVARIQEKYNREIVSELTGLTGDELMKFMMYCRFNYYDLVRMDDETIKAKIKAKFFEYKYNKAINDQ